MCRLITNTYDGSGMVKLYRYDLECPPTDWSNEYKNVEYIYEGECDALRVKNQIGAFFFFERKYIYSLWYREYCCKKK